jgi:predicted nucleic acid-binding protein
MEKRKKYLVDTSVIIALFRGNDDAKEVLEGLDAENTYICDITVMEILAGCFTVEKRGRTMAMLSAFRRVSSSELVSAKALQLMERYCIRQIGRPALMLPDCLIAANALVYKMELVTFNKKDFVFIKGINIHYRSK